MTQTNILELAKQGDAKAIAALMNRQLQPKGITAKVALKDGCAQIMLESAQVPDQQALVAWACKSITGLGAESIERVKIYGRQAGEELPAWSQEFELAGQQIPLPKKAVKSVTLNAETQQQQPSLKEQAKQGDLDTITTLLNFALEHKNITAKASLKDGCLQVMLESASVPDEEASIRIIRRELASLKVASITIVKVCGRITGEEFPTWSQEVERIPQANSRPLPPKSSSRTYKKLPALGTTSNTVIFQSNKPANIFGRFRNLENLNKIVNFIKGKRNLQNIQRVSPVVGAFLLFSGFFIGIRILNFRYTITGGIDLRDEQYEYRTAGMSCIGSGGYDDFDEGTQVVVKDNQGKTIAVGDIKAGTIRASSCFFPIEIKNVPHSDFYMIEIGSGRRGNLTYSQKELKDRDWKLNLSLGD